MNTRGGPGVDLRASDADRQVVVAELQQHFEAGRLSSEELRERVGLALAARTQSALTPLLRDLPPIHAPAAAPTPAVEPNSQPLQAPVRQGLRNHLISYGLVMALLVAIWLLTSPGGYFWPIWPILGWGFALAMHGLVGGRTPRHTRHQSRHDRRHRSDEA